MELPEKTVLRGLPDRYTVDCWQKPVPFTVSVVSEPPALTEEGAIEVMAGSGFTTVTEAEPVPLGVATLLAFTVTVLLGDGGTPGAV